MHAIWSIITLIQYHLSPLLWLLYPDQIFGEKKNNSRKYGVASGGNGGCSRVSCNFLYSGVLDESFQFISFQWYILIDACCQKLNIYVMFCNTWYFIKAFDQPFSVPLMQYSKVDDIHEHCYLVVLVCILLMYICGSGPVALKDFLSDLEHVWDYVWRV